MDRMNFWRVVDTAVWALVPVLGTVLALAGIVSGDPVTASLGAVVGLGGAWKAASTL